MLQAHQIANPKRHLDREEIATRKLFPYYAGFASSFVEHTLDSLDLGRGAKVLDPWNGSGTTTTTAFEQGLTAVGSDLNPVMVLVAKAALVSRLDVDSLVSLAHSMVEKLDDAVEQLQSDPLLNWFQPRAVALLRGLEGRINRMLVSHDVYMCLDTPSALARVSPLAAFFYLVLFRVVRRWAQDFVASNPTWLRVAKEPSQRKRVSKATICQQFTHEVEQLCAHRDRFPIYGDADQGRLQLLLANAEKLPLESESIDAIVTSPPYCTRIDYAVATYIELAALRIGGERFSALRRTLTGTSTVRSNAIEINAAWGTTCENFLNAVHEHPSKASKTYYFKSHLQYFESLHKSLKETVRVLTPKAPCVLVVQNSYYKDVRNDVATVVVEMMQALGGGLASRADFSASRSMVDVNQRSKKYIGDRSTVESVLVFRKY